MRLVDLVQIVAIIAWMYRRDASFGAGKIDALVLRIDKLEQENKRLRSITMLERVGAFLKTKLAKQIGGAMWLLNCATGGANASRAFDHLSPVSFGFWAAFVVISAVLAWAMISSAATTGK